MAIVGLLAGVFSSCDSQINAFCTIFTTDIYKGMLRKNASDRQMLRVSKIAGVIFTLAAISTAVIFSFAKDGMFLFAVGIVATIMPPFGAIAIWGALWRKASPRAAQVALVTGMLFAATLFVLDWTGNLKQIAQDTLFLRSGATFLLTSAVLLLMSSFDNYHDTLQPHDSDDDAQKSGTNPRKLAIALVLAVILMYLVASLLR